jgi:hypothetical protein
MSHHEVSRQNLKVITKILVLCEKKKHKQISQHDICDVGAEKFSVVLRICGIGTANYFCENTLGRLARAM